MEDVDWLYGDDDASYCQVMTYRAEDLVPVCACPSQVDNIHPVSEVEGTKLDQVFIGSCTNGRLEDLAVQPASLRAKLLPASSSSLRPAVRSIWTPSRPDT